MAVDEKSNELASIRRSVVELVVLESLSERPAYAYELAKNLRAVHDLCCPESDLYGSLKRMQRHGLLGYFWRESQVGPPRKYYFLTPAGQAMLIFLEKTWTDLAASVAAFNTRRRSRREAMARKSTGFSPIRAGL